MRKELEFSDWTDYFKRTKIMRGRIHIIISTAREDVVSRMLSNLVLHKPWNFALKGVKRTAALGLPLFCTVG